MTEYSLPTKFDPLIHQSSRLSIVAVLAGCESADFTYLLQATGLTKGTLSKHLTKLRDAGYVEIEKGFKGKQKLKRETSPGPGKLAGLRTDRSIGGRTAIGTSVRRPALN